MTMKKNTNQEFDAAFIRKHLSYLDKDVATRFLFSGISLSKIKIEDAFILACQEMEIREEERKRKKGQSIPGAGEKPVTTDKLSTEALIKLFEDILTTTKKQQ